MSCVSTADDLREDLRVLIFRRLDQPTTARMWHRGVLVFDGIDPSALHTQTDPAPEHDHRLDESCPDECPRRAWMEARGVTGSGTLKDPYKIPTAQAQPPLHVVSHHEPPPPPYRWPLRVEAWLRWAADKVAQWDGNR